MRNGPYIDSLPNTVCRCGGFGSNASSILVLVSCGLAPKDSIPSTSRWSWGSWAPWPERGEFPMRFVGTGGAKVSKGPAIQEIQWRLDEEVFVGPAIIQCIQWRVLRPDEEELRRRRGTSATKGTSSRRRQNFVSSLIRCCDEVWTSSWLSKMGRR